jgi:hypothetical protein
MTNKSLYGQRPATLHHGPGVIASGERVARGCIPLPVNEATLDQFVRWGFLRVDARHDPASIVQVFYKLAKCGLGNSRRADPVESLAA